VPAVTFSAGTKQVLLWHPLNVSNLDAHVQSIGTRLFAQMDGSSVRVRSAGQGMTTGKQQE
jgi:hypothetical protein